VAAGTAVLTLGYYSAYTYVTPLLAGAGIRPGSVSLVLFGFGAGSFVGLLLVGAVADRWPRPALVGVIGLNLACLVGLALTTGSAAATVVVVVVWGAAFGGLPTLLQAVALGVTTPDAASAVVNAMFNVGIAGGAWLGGQLLLGPGARPLVLTSAAILAVGAVLLSALARSHRPAPA
jgi:MFS transporter, DHA1 family, inner membrane transport protein